MKKRILSMLLAVVMMVTAMPLFILASSAEEATPVYPSTTKEEYNALYVQEGLVLQYDFFDSNEYWGGDYSDGTNRLTLDSTYTMEVAKSDFDGKYRIYYSPLYGNSNNARIGVNGIAVYPTVGEGYMALKLDGGCKWGGNALGSKGRYGTYMINTGFVNTEGTYTYTLQQVTSYTDLANLRTESEYSNIKNHPQYYIGNVSIYMAANADGNFYFDKVSDGFNTGTKVDASSTAASHSFKPGEIIDYTAVLSQPEGEGASAVQPGTVGFYVNGKEAYRNDAFPFTNLPSTRYADDYYAVWRGAYEGSTYAIRYYNIALTEEHIAKNHFADLAKYFRLDLTSYNTYKDSLTDAQMKNALASLSSVTFDNTREEAQAAVDKAFEPALLDDSYYAGFEGAVDEKILAVAKKFKLNIDIFKVMPIALMKKTRAWFAAVDLNGESLDATAVQAEFIRKTEEDILDCAGESVLDADGYNALYEKNGLVLQYDFFDSNKYWGGDYSDGTNRLTLDSTYKMDAAKSDFDGKYRIYYSPLYGNSNNARIGVNGIAVYPTVGEGYMALKLDGGCKYNGNALGSKGSGGNYMINTGFVNTEGTYTYTLQQVTSYTDLASLRTESEYSNIKDRPQYYIGNVSIYMAANADGNFYFDKVSDGFNTGTKVDASSTAASHSFKPGEIIDYTAVLSQPLGEGEGASVAQPGTVGFYVNGKEAYRNDAFPFTNLPSTRYANDYYAVWRGAYEGSTYAIRYYNIALTEKHIAKNHFADVAKWYKLGLVGWDTLTDAEKETIYEAFADVTVDDANYSRAEAQALYVNAYYKILQKLYAPLYEIYTQDKEKGLIDLAAAWLLPIDTLENVLSSDRNMEYVYKNITIDTLSATENVSACFEKAYKDAYNYYSFADGMNDAFIAKAAELGLDITKLMSMPSDERAWIYSLSVETLTKESYQTAFNAAFAKYAHYDFAGDVASYNALYVQEGLVLQYDFFDSNEYWGGDYSDGTNRLTLDSTYTMEVAKSDFDAKYRIYYSPLYGNSNNARIGVNGIAVYPTVGEGYMALKLDGGCKWGGNALGSKGRYGTYMINTGFVNTEGTYTYTLQQVTSYTDLANLRTEGEYSNIKNHPQYYIGNVSIYMAANADGNFYFDKVSDGFNTGTKVDASSTAASHSFKPGEIIDYTAVLSQPEGEGASAAQPGTVGFYVNGKEAYRNDAFPFTNLPSTRYADDYYAVWRGAYEGSTYAIRYYNIALTEEHIAKNHFADVAKWYKLDLSGFAFLTDAEKKQVYTDFLAVTVDDPAYTRNDVQALYLASVAEIHDYESMKIDNETVDTFIDLAAEASVSAKMVRAITTLPASIRDAIIAAVNKKFEGETVKCHAVVAYYLEIIAEEVMSVRYAAYENAGKVYTHEEYNALYARLDRLNLWYDFFAATKDDPECDLLNTDGALFSSATHPSVFRKGTMQIANYPQYDPARRMENGFFRMEATKDGKLAGFANVSIGLDSIYNAEHLYQSDYTFEMVISDINGFQTPIQIDGVRVNFGVSGSQFKFDAAYEVGYLFSSNSAYAKDAINDSIFYASNLTRHELAGSRDTLGVGNTITLRMDKDFTEKPILYYQCPPNDDHTYSRDNITVITKEEAMTLLGYTAETEAAFDALMAIPEEPGKAASDNFSTFQYANGTNILVYAARHMASAQNTGYLNGEQLYNYKSSYGYNFNAASLGSGVDMNVYSVRRYDVVLTEAEIAQNHFVDLCKYYGLDITAYLALDEAGRAFVHEAMKGYFIADEANKALMMEAYAEALKATYYDNQKIDGEDAYNAFLDAAATSMIDITSLLALPKSIRLRMGTAAGVASLGYEREAYINRGLYEEILLEAIPKTDPVYLAQQLISFSGYSVRVTGSYDKDEEAIAGIRSTFVINQKRLAELIENNTEISFGAIVKNPTSGMSAELVVYDKGQLPTVIPEGKTVEDYTVNGFNFVGNAYERANALGETELCYTYTTLYDAMKVNGTETPWDEIDFARRKAVVSSELEYSWFVQFGEGEENKYVFECKSPTFGDAVSATEVYDYFRNDGAYSEDAVIGDISAIKLGDTDKATLYNLTVNGEKLADMTIVYGQGFTKQDAEAVAKVLYDLTGVTVPVVEQGFMMVPSFYGEKAGTIIWLVTDTVEYINAYGMAHALQGPFGWYGRYGALTIAVKDNTTVSQVAELLREKLISLADENSIAVSFDETPTLFGTVAE